MDPAALIPIGAVVTGLAGVFITLLRFQRDDASKVVSQTEGISGMWKQLLEEVQDELGRCRTERLVLETKCEDLKGQLKDSLAATEKLQGERRAISVRLDQCKDREDALQNRLRAAEREVHDDEN